MSSPSHRTKYRPYFTSDEMLELITSLKENPTPKRLKLIQYLESFNLKITHGLIEPSQINKPSLAESMGFLEESSKISLLTPDKRREIAYKLWLVNPSSCTPSQLKDVNEYRYANKLLSAEEQIAFEKSLGISLD